MGVFELTHQVGVRHQTATNRCNAPLQPNGPSFMLVFLSYLIFVPIYAALLDDAADGDNTAFRRAGSPGK
jgi:hypothetical protein